MSTDLPEWHGNGDAMRALQLELAKQVVLRDNFPKPLHTVAGFDVGFENRGAITRAAAVLLDANTLEVLDQQIARLPTRMPYVPGLLSFRELPALLEALALLKHTPDIALVDGHGLAHPRRIGIASHFGVATGLPSIGVGKSIHVGETKMALHDMRGAFTPLRDKGEQIGWLLRSKPNCLPLVVSPGHKVSMAAAPELVMRFVTTYRLPEPTRLADRLASRRDRQPA